MNLYEKIAAIQDEVQHIKKDADNPFYKSRYSTYENVLDSIHQSMRKHKLVAYHGFSEPKFDSQICVTTIIIDTEGDAKIESSLHIPAKANDPQAAGSAITYAKRYSLLAMLGLGTEDDDGNTASNIKVDDYDANSDDVAKRVTCPIHKVPMKHFLKDGQEWWSHKTNEGWCNGRPANYNRSQTV